MTQFSAAKNLLAAAAVVAAGCGTDPSEVKASQDPGHAAGTPTAVGTDLSDASLSTGVLHNFDLLNVEREIDTMRTTLTKEGVVSFSPEMCKVLADCFSKDSREALAKHFRHAEGGTQDPESTVLAVQGLLLSIEKLGDNSPQQLDGLYGNTLRSAIKGIQDDLVKAGLRGEGASQGGTLGEEFSSRTVARILQLGSESGGVSFENPEFAKALQTILPAIHTIVTAQGAFPTHYDPEIGRSETARALQSALYELGYFGEASFERSVDGEWGKSSEDALKTFQAAKGLDQDGVAGPTTTRELFAAVLSAAANRGASADGLPSFGYR